MGKYVNPIPYVDKCDRYELRLAVKYDEPIAIEKAKELAAEWIRGLTKEELIEILREVRR